ncbi:hypothetical protein PS664_00094 [Pseudomonas fluorescens]|nr:hypothetical protein PS664_00094 [Pseudomonas fluorescens]
MMGLIFVKEPEKTEEEQVAVSKSQPWLSSSQPLTVAEEALVSGYEKRRAEFYETHHYVLEDVSESQQLFYIFRHRGGVVFHGTNGLTTAQLEAYAVQTLSTLKNGDYKRKDGVSYSYADFKNDVRNELKSELKKGWVKKTDNLSGYIVIEQL